MKSQRHQTLRAHPEQTQTEDFALVFPLQEILCSGVVCVEKANSIKSVTHYSRLASVHSSYW